MTQDVFAPLQGAVEETASVLSDLRARLRSTQRERDALAAELQTLRERLAGEETPDPIESRSDAVDAEPEPAQPRMDPSEADAAATRAERYAQEREAVRGRLQLLLQRLEEVGLGE